MENNNNVGKLSKEYFDEHTTSENKQELLTIGEMANAELYDKLSIGIQSAYISIAAYGKIMETIIEYVIEKEETYKEYCISIADRLKVGYTNTDNEDDEKSGNFMIHFEHVDNTSPNTSIDDDDEKGSIELCVQWNASNIKSQTEEHRDIAVNALKKLAEIKLILSNSELIIPMFCIIHKEIINFIKTKKLELGTSEYELDVLGIYNIGIEETGDGEENIFITPTISSKLDLKDDAKATGSKEE